MRLRQGEAIQGVGMSPIFFKIKDTLLHATVAAPYTGFLSMT